MSTTHSLAGALLGATTVAVGAGGVLWSSAAVKIAIPLLASPLLAVALVLAVLPALRPFIRRIDRYCLCVEQKEPVAIAGIG
ncbi:MAG: inorganic phosphate transporter, partial [Thermoanaerobaculia bacterium]